jgi:hypothetical protein
VPHVKITNPPNSGGFCGLSTLIEVSYQSSIACDLHVQLASSTKHALSMLIIPAYRQPKVSFKVVHRTDWPFHIKQDKPITWLLVNAGPTSLHGSYKIPSSLFPLTNRPFTSLVPKKPISGTPSIFSPVLRDELYRLYIIVITGFVAMDGLEPNWSQGITIIDVLCSPLS